MSVVAEVGSERAQSEHTLEGGAHRRRARGSFNASERGTKRASAGSDGRAFDLRLCHDELIPLGQMLHVEHRLGEQSAVAGRSVRDLSGRRGEAGGACPEDAGSSPVQRTVLT